MDDRKLAGVVEQCLKNLGFAFIKNQGMKVTEFEVQSPCHFIVSIENTTRGQLSFLVRSPIRVEAAIEVRRLIGSHDPETRLQECASAVAAELRKKLPDEPWKGSGIIGSGNAKRNWESLGEL